MKVRKSIVLWAVFGGFALAMLVGAMTGLAWGQNDYPKTTGIGIADITCPPALSGDCVDLGTNDEFLVGHTAAGLEKATHFDDIPGPLLPQGAQDVGGASDYWTSSFITTQNSTCIQNTAAPLQIECGGEQNVTLFENDASGANTLQIHGPGSANYLGMFNDGSNGYIEPTAGQLVLNYSGVGDVSMFNGDDGGQSYLNIFDGVGASIKYLRMGHDGTNGIISSQPDGAVAIQSDLVLTGTNHLLKSNTDLFFAESGTSGYIALADAGSGTGSNTDLNDFPAGDRGIVDALNYLLLNISGAATLQIAYDNGKTINATSGDPFVYSAYASGAGTEFTIDSNSPIALKVCGEDYSFVDPYDECGLIGFESSGNIFNIGHETGGTAVYSSGITALVGSYVELRGYGDPTYMTKFNWPSTIDATYESEITTPTSKDLLISGGSGASTKVTAGNFLFVDSTTQTRIGSAGPSTQNAVMIGTSSDRDGLMIYGQFQIDQYTNGPKGTGAFSGATTVTITNSIVTAGSHVHVQPTSQPSGTWWVTKASGSFTVRSTATEAITTFDYLVIN